MPRRRLRLVSYNVHWNLAGVDRVVATVKPLEPDFLFLAEVPRGDLPAMAKALGMTSDGTPQIYYSPRPPEGTSGTAILARYPLANGRPVSEDWRAGGWGFGAWAETTVDGRRFALACVHLVPTQEAGLRHVRDREAQRGREIAAVLDLWRDRGAPPLLLGGDFNQLPAGANYQALSRSVSDALGSLGKADYTCSAGWLRSRIDYLWLSPHWKPAAGDVVDADASDHRPIWADVVPAEEPPEP